MDLTLYNTRSRSLEVFRPIAPPLVTMYNCGPTVYNYPHIGNLRAYVFADTLRRVLEANGYQVKQVMNITDVGHLVSDADQGEDKMVVGAQREGKSIEEIIALYSNAFYSDLEQVNCRKAFAYPRATNYIAEQKEMVELLAEKGFTYTTSDGIYFDTGKFPTYSDFARLDIAGMQAGARIDMGEKRNLTDFALWKFSPVTDPASAGRREQEWPSPLVPLRMGFPGWHIECSAIIKTLLGNTIDIHTGGVDHIPVHHSNEIAQSVAANDAPFVNYWLHVEHMLVDGEKMSKSLGNAYRLKDLHERGIPPLAYRYWLLTAHYRTQVNFTWEAMAGAQSAYNKLTNVILSLEESDTEPDADYMRKFFDAMNLDLNTANAIGILWTLVKDEAVNPSVKYATLMRMNDVLGLGLKYVKHIATTFVVPEEVAILVRNRERARNEKNWPEADRLRDEIAKLGYLVKDTPEGQKVSKL